MVKNTNSTRHRQAKQQLKAERKVEYVIDTLVYKIQNICIKDNFMCIRIKVCNHYFIVCAVYFSPNQDIDICLNELGETISYFKNLFPKDSFILGGDFNCRVGSSNQFNDWEIFDGTCCYKYRTSFDKVVNTRGKKLTAFMEDFGLLLLNGRTFSDTPAQYTYISNIGNSVIDLMWCNLEALDIVKDFNVLNIATRSDHFPVILSLINIYGICNHSKFKKCSKIIWKADIQETYCNKMYFDNNVANLYGDVNDMNLNLISTIKSNAKKAGMYTKNSIKKNIKPWYNSDCAMSKKNLKKSLKMCKINSFTVQEDINKYINEKKKYKNLIMHAKKQYTESKLDTLAKSNNNNEFWKNLNIFRRKKQAINYISLNNWYNHLKNTFPQNTRMDAVLPDTSDPILDVDISLDELNFSLAKCKLNKSAGYDGIVNEFLLALPGNWKLYLVVLFNRIMSYGIIPDDWANIITIMLHKKGDPQNPDNYRPIALVNAVTKLFTQILYQRVLKWCNKNDAIPEFQSGFRAGRGCLDNIFTLNSIIQLQLQKKGKLFAFFVDFKRAFPSINHALLWQKLARKGLSSKIINILISLYSKAKMSIKIGDQISMSVNISEGVLQGEVLSPIIFALFLADLLDFLEGKGIEGVNISCNYNITLLAYADDLVFLASSSVGIKKLLRALHEYCTLNFLSLNPDKSKIIVFKKGGQKPEYNFYYGNIKIEVVNEYIYLGICFSNSGLYEKAAKIIIAKANLAAASTISLLGSTKFLIAWSKVNLLFDSLVSSLISHASPVWSLRYLDMIEKIQCQFFKKTLNIPRNTPNYAVRLEINRPHLAVHILRMILAWLAKLVKMSATRYTYICFQKLVVGELNRNIIIKYNWVAMVKSIFFNPIEELEVWNDLNNFLIPQVIDRIIVKYKRYLYKLDIESVHQSGSLLLYPSLGPNFLNENYLSFNINFEIKKIFSQCRLLNCYNNRIVTRRGIYKLGSLTECNYCNMEDINLLHMIFICERFVNTRLEFFGNENVSNDMIATLIDKISQPNPTFIKKFIVFVNVILDSCVNENIIDLCTYT